MTLCVCVIPIFTGKVIAVDPKTGDIPMDEKPFANYWVAGAFTVLKYLIMLGLYVGALVVVYGIITFEPPKGTWPGDQVPPVSPAVQCTMILSAQFFLVYGGIQVCKSVDDWLKIKMENLNKALNTATLSINFAPMLAVLFIGARMRALQMDPVNGAPQKWAQNCFFMCTYALALQTTLCVVIPVVLGGKVKKGDTEGDMVYEVSNTGVATVLSIVKFGIMFCIYVGFTAVIWSILTIQHPQGPQYTPPVSVTMQCVINLTVQFFTVYFMLWVCNTVREFLGFADNWMIKLLSDTMDAAKGTINYCPMLAILFVGTRMRALMITNNKGAPQGWVQDGMYIATWAVLVQFLMVLGVAAAMAFQGATAEIQTDKDGTVTWKPTNTWANYIMQALKWVTFIFLYGGIIAVIVGVYTMTPQTANGRGSIPLAGDGKIPLVDAKVPGYDGVKEPVGPNDLPVPGMETPKGAPVATPPTF